MLRKYIYLLALAKERHFGRAAAACNVSQPTLSNAVRQLERDYGVMIVERGQRFRGFTEEGLKVIERARRIVAEEEALLQELHGPAADLEGRLRLGAIPTALPVIAQLVGPFEERYPKVQVSVLSMSSREIEKGLHDFELDVGVTYLDNEPLSNVRMLPLYTERYFFLTRRSEVVDGRTTMTWREAADFNLCLLTPDMQNRRITEGVFRIADRAVAPTLETNSLMNLVTSVQFGSWSSIVPGQLLAFMSPQPELVALPLVEPEAAYLVGTVYADRDPPVPLAEAFAIICSDKKVIAELEQFTAGVLARIGTESPG
jgi:DNA-binding transcriptional LysR family regulator